MEINVTLNHYLMRKSFPFLVLVSLSFCKCKQPEMLMLTIVDVPPLSCEDKSPEWPARPTYEAVVSVGSIFYQKDTQQIDILPKTFGEDTSDLRQSIQKHLRYPEMCKKMEVQGSLYFEISKDSLNQFSEFKILRAFDHTCTDSVLKEIRWILKKEPIIDMSPEINSFIVQIKIYLR